MWLEYKNYERGCLSQVPAPDCPGGPWASGPGRAPTKLGVAHLRRAREKGRARPAAGGGTRCGSISVQRGADSLGRPLPTPADRWRANPLPSGGGAAARAERVPSSHHLSGRMGSLEVRGASGGVTAGGEDCGVPRQEVVGVPAVNPGLTVADPYGPVSRPAEKRRHDRCGLSCSPCCTSSIGVRINWSSGGIDPRKPDPKIGTCRFFLVCGAGRHVQN